MVIVEEAHFNENVLIYCFAQWEHQLFQFSKQHKTLKKIRGLEEDVITKEELLGGETISSLQSYRYFRSKDRSNGTKPHQSS